MSGTAIAAENPWRFSSKRQDPTTDWVHYEFRVYDPSSGRWLSRDPIGEAGGENLYGFVGNDPVNGVDLFGLQETGGGMVALQLIPPPVLPRQFPAGSTPCSASVPRISVPLPQCNPIADVIWGKPVQAPQPCPPRHFIGAPTPGPKIPVPRGLTSAEAYRYNSFLMAFGSSGLCDSPIGFRLAQINMQLINHAAAIPSQAQVDGVLRFGGAVLERIGRCGGNLPRFPCTGPSPCLLEGGMVAQALSKAERLRMVYDRVLRAPPATTAEEAMALMHTTLDAVEDSFSCVPKLAKPGLKPDGRMYPAQPDRIVKGADGSLTATSRGHVTTYGPDGSITVTDRATGEIVFQKLGGG
jgi:RHS repeat-associated protein